MVRNPAWLLAIAGDFVGFVLQIVALSAGPVVIIQPLVVLMLPVSLGVSFLLGGPRPRLGDYLGVLGRARRAGACSWPSSASPATGTCRTRATSAWRSCSCWSVGIVLVLAVTGRNRIIRGAMYGAVAGAYFGTLAVMVDAASDRAAHAGLHGLLGHARAGWCPLAGIVLCGAGGIILTQLSFQVGALGATLPANLAADPLIGGGARRGAAARAHPALGRAPDRLRRCAWPRSSPARSGWPIPTAGGTGTPTADASPPDRGRRRPTCPRRGERLGR